MSPPAPPELTLLVPAFNEEAQLARCLSRIASWRAARPELEVEVLVVDDGSRDGTPSLLAAWAAADGGARWLRRESNAGKGAALRLGMLEARGRVVVFLDADLAVDVEHVDLLLPHLRDGADVAVGCRHVPGARIVRAQSRGRRWLGLAYLRLARLLLGLRVADVTCGFKGFRREAAHRLFGASRARRWGIDAEVLFLARRLGLVVREVPVTWKDGERTSVRLRRDVGSALWELLAVRWGAKRRLR